MILVDSCVWIDLLKDKATPAVRLLADIRKNQRQEVCLSSIIYFEVLRGISFGLERKKVQKALNLLQCKDYLNTDFDDLIALYLKAQSQGLTFPKLGDWLILKTALDHRLALLTSDKGFARLKQTLGLELELL